MLLQVIPRYSIKLLYYTSIRAWVQLSVSERQSSVEIVFGMNIFSLVLKGLNWLKELIVWSWTYLWAAWFVLVCIILFAGFFEPTYLIELLRTSLGPFSFLGWICSVLLAWAP